MYHFFITTCNCLESATNTDRSLNCYLQLLGHFYPRGASDARVLAIIVCLSVCLCVCLSVTRRYCIKMAKRRITQTQTHKANKQQTWGSEWTREEQRRKGGTPGPRGVWELAKKFIIANRKSAMRFALSHRWTLCLTF